jgi:hypothetical protein
LISAAVLALAVPTLAAPAKPRAFCGALLTGWAGGGAALVMASYTSTKGANAAPYFVQGYESGERGAVLAFATTLAALLVLTVAFWGPTTRATDPTPSRTLVLDAPAATACLIRGRGAIGQGLGARRTCAARRSTCA